MLRQDVNFFGHAAVASWSSQTAATVLGAMLPDFATMSGARLHPEGPHEPPLATGIDLHHATDATFHRLPVVTGLMRELDARLADGGCARGPRRAVAHVGVELLLDGVLVDEPAYREAYAAGLTHDPTATWRDPADPARITRLLERLRAHGIPEDLRDPAAITHRLGRMLAHRPLLAPSPDDLRAIRAAITAFQDRVSVAVDTVVRGLRASLGT